MNALNFACLAFVAHLLWAEVVDDWIEAVGRIVMIVGIAAFVGWRLGGWM
jgi:hypothetical protein